MTSEQEKARLLHLYESSLRAHFENDARTFWLNMPPSGMRYAMQESGFAQKKKRYLPSSSISSGLTSMTSVRLLPQSSISQ